MSIERELLKRFMTELKTEDDVVSLFNGIKECLAQPEQSEQELVTDKPTETAMAVMPNGVCVSNVYDAYEAGRASVLLAQPEQEPINFDLERMKAAIESPISDVTVDDLAKQVKQEPVAWIIETEIYGKLSEWVCTDKKHYMEAHDSIKEPIPLYLAPPKRKQTEQEPVAWMWEDKRNETNSWVTVVSPAKPEKCEHVRNLIPLYTSPPKREPLSTKQAEDLWETSNFKSAVPYYIFDEICVAIEKQHGIGGGE